MEVKVDLKDYLGPKVDAILTSYDINAAEGLIEELCKLFEETAGKLVTPTNSFSIWPAGVRDVLTNQNPTVVGGRNVMYSAQETTLNDLDLHRDRGYNNIPLSK